MAKIACIFPGQGSQAVGMGLDFFNNYAPARKIFELADIHSGTSLSKIIFEGPEVTLKRTIYTQPAILVVSLCAWDAYAQTGGCLPDFVAGHSLGEYTALVSAGVLSLEDAIKLVIYRARLMENCPPGAMSAVIGASREIVDICCRSASTELGGSEIVIVANFNTSDQLVISGSPAGVKRAEQLLKEQGAKVIPLPVGGAFHSPLMQLAADQFADYISGASFGNAAHPVVQNYDAQPAVAADEIRSKLIKQMCSPVRWSDSIQYMLSQGVDTFIEIGPGKALTGMVKKLSKDAQVFNISSIETLRAVIPKLTELTVD